MEYKSTFGLVCCELLEEFKRESKAPQPYLCIWRTQHRLADESAKRIPSELLTVDPDNEKSFILAAEKFYCNLPHSIRLHHHHRHGHDVLPAWSDDTLSMPNSDTCDSIVRCLEGWIRWDNATASDMAPVDRGSSDPHLVTKKELTKLLMSPSAQSLMKSKKITWPKAKYAPDGKAHSFDYFEVRDAISKSSLGNRDTLLGRLPADFQKARILIQT